LIGLKLKSLVEDDGRCQWIGTKLIDFSSLEKSFFYYSRFCEVDMDDGNKLLENCEKWKM